jgi:hypothetical protein
MGRRQGKLPGEDVKGVEVDELPGVSENASLFR